MIWADLTNHLLVLLPFMYVVGMVLTLIIYVLSSVRAGRMKDQHEFMKTLVYENNYLKGKAAYLETKVEKLEEEHQRQLNLQAVEICRIVELVESNGKKALVIPPTINDQEITPVVNRPVKLDFIMPPNPNQGHSIGRPQKGRGRSFIPRI